MEEQASEKRPGPTPLDLPSFVPYACIQLQAPFEVKVIPVTEHEPGIKAKHSRRLTHHSTHRSTLRTSSLPMSKVLSSSSPSDITIIALRDHQGNFVELVFWRCNQIPCLLLKIISLCIPYNLFLTKMSIRWGPSQGFSLKEIATFLPQSYLTEICFDDSPLHQCNVHLLFETSTSLRHLSLARCCIDDEGCSLIVNKLAHPFPASKTLRSLSLSSNFISDDGARAVANTLRSNRSLLHVDLADNKITDAGAAWIFQILMEFSLSEEEILARNRRRFEFLKLRNNYIRPREELPSVADKENLVPNSRTSKKLLRGTIGKRKPISFNKTTEPRPSSPKSSFASLTVASESMMSKVEWKTLHDLRKDPFSKRKTLTRNGDVFSFGNMKLASLNLAYNHLQVSSASWLHRVLLYQNSWRERNEDSVRRGLVRVVLDGNPIPEACEHLRAAEVLLRKSVVEKQPKRFTIRAHEV